MSLTTGTRLGPYDIVSPLGAGGMGEVYRATDTRLKRQVAIKILPETLAADPDRLARFQREAEVLASLNHPHIAAIYGFEDALGMKALVMELVEGPTLADRIADGPLPIDEALPIAAQIADALEAAHERGIVHRDLKPANIKVRHDGTVKVLDFGLAKLSETRSDRSGFADPSQSPTLTSPAAMTGMGMILGTAAYMSPEQARGRAVDKRTDVWAFGAVLYEMLTGRRAFDGEDVTEMMASVVKSTPNWAALPSNVSPNVVTLIKRCLEKDLKARAGDIAVARFLLSDAAPVPAVPASTAHAHVAPVGRARYFQTIGLVLAAVVAGAAIGWLLRGRPAVPAPVTHLQVSVQPADHLVESFASPRPSRTAIALSPDGRLLVFSGTQGAVAQLYLRRLDRPDAAPIPGTERGVAPFFSPDGAWIGFWADNKIKKVPAAGGPIATICDVPPGGGQGATWAHDGTIFYANRGTISRVPSAGSAATVVATPGAAKGERQLLPQVLPDGNALIYTVTTSADWDTANVVVQSLDTGERRVIIQSGADARYVSTGHLVYLKSGTLMAVPFDVRSRQITGAPVAVIQDVMQAVNASNGNDETGAGQFALSDGGTLAYVVGGTFSFRQDSFVSVDRKGAPEALKTAPPASYLGPRWSPDGQKIAVAVRRVAPRGADLWLYDVARGAPTRLTFGVIDGSPVWSPDGKRLVYGASGIASPGIYVIDADGGGKAERVADGGAPSSWAAGTNSIAFLRRTETGSNGIWVLPASGDRTPQLFLESRFTLWFPELSPDGHLMAYVSNESGASELYVQTYPGSGAKIRVSTNGGREPIWTSNGRELVYRSFTREGQQFFSATVRSASPLTIDAPRLLFEAKAGEYDATAPERSWDAGADGRKFLLSRPVESTERPVGVVQVVLNWTDELKRLAPAK
jgi:eukaryotic-like serine/threonine-protein kinase